MQGIREKYEAFHGVRISDSAIEAAVRLSVRYMENRRLPDKAIDLIDQACAAARIKETGSTPDLDDVNKRLRELSAEKEAAVLLQDFEQAARIRTKERSLEAKAAELKDNESKSKRHIIIDESDVAVIAGIHCKLPLSRISADEAEQVMGLEKELKKRVIGQDEAVKAVAAAIKRGRSGIGRKNRPMGTFLFAGPTGVGKTELSKALSEALFGDTDSLIRFDMAEYMEKHSVSGLIGAPAGYVGYEDGGRLIEAVKKKPYSVVLFDEIEKAHPDVLNLLLQILDYGHVTSADGRKVSMKNCIVIMTTNEGSAALKSQRLGFGDREAATDEKPLERAFRPEFLNRIDEIVIFRPLSEADIGVICGKMLDELKSRVSDAGYELEITEKAKEKLAVLGYSGKYGARNLYRTIVRLVENPVSEEILTGCGKRIVFSEDRIKP